MVNSNKIGKAFENALSNKFDEYKKKGLAFISKVPTDWIVIRNGGRISTAYPKAKSEFLDYVGVLEDGSFITIEAKTTSNKTSFPLSMIKDYQFELIEKCYQYTDKVYIIVGFRQQQEEYIFDAAHVLDFEEKYNRKSIPYDWFLLNAIKIKDFEILDALKTLENSKKISK